MVTLLADHMLHKFVDGAVYDAVDNVHTPVSQPLIVTSSMDKSPRYSAVVNSNFTLVLAVNVSATYTSVTSVGQVIGKLTFPPANDCIRVQVDHPSVEYSTRKSSSESRAYVLAEKLTFRPVLPDRSRSGVLNHIVLLFGLINAAYVPLLGFHVLIVAPPLIHVPHHPAFSNHWVSSVVQVPPSAIQFSYAEVPHTGSFKALQLTAVPPPVPLQFQV